jgi:tetratricopeptide (TPR) repeat protein
MTNEPNQNASLYLGDALAKLERYEEAIVAYRKAITTDPNSSEAYIKLAEVLVKLGRLQEAEPIYRRITELNANFKDIPPEIAKLSQQVPPAPLATQQQTTIAKLQQKAIQKTPHLLANYYTAIDFQPQELSLYVSLGNTLAKQGHLDKAIVVYRLALQLNPNLSEGYYNLAQIFTYNERYPEAVECWRKFRQLEPNRFQSDDYCKFGKVLFALGEYAEALIFLRQTLESQPDNYDAHYLLGQILASEKQWGEAIARYKQASKIQPQRWEAHYLVAEAWQEIGNLVEAEKGYRQAIAAKGDIYWCYNGLGSILLKLRRWEEAVGVYRRSIELKGDFPWAHFNLGEACAALDRIDEAIVAYRQAINLQPNLVRAREKLGSLLRQRAKRDLAEAANYIDL